MKLSLVIPCYNEAKNIPLLLDRCGKFPSSTNIEVILVDNGSTDSTVEVLEKLLPFYPTCRSIRVEVNEGYGHGILAGLKVADGELLGWTHADMQTDPLDILRALKEFENGHKVFVKGKRYGRPMADIFFTMGMSVFESLLMRKTMHDINAQPTVFSKEFFDSWDDPPKDFSLDLFAYYMARATKIKVKRIPVMFGERAFGASHWNINWKAKWKFILRTVTYSLKLRRRV